MSSSAMQDPLDPTRWLIASAAEAELGMQQGAAVLTGVHSDRACEGQGCSIHHPSEHHMRDWALNWRDDRGLMERLCPSHGVGHPDPDDLAYKASVGIHGDGVHGCCGCCRKA